MKWPMVEISRFCQTGSGGTPSRNNAGDYYGGNIPWVKSGELNQEFVLNTEERITELAIKESSAKIVPAGAILVAMYGATVGKSALLGIDAATNQAICNIIPDPEAADARYVWYALKNQLPYLLAQRVGGAQPNISQQIIKNTQISLPALSEQRRIVEILDQADNLRKLRIEVDKKTERILPVLFNKVFGDPATNPMGWATGSLVGAGASVRYGLGQPPLFCDDGIPFIRATNIHKGIISTKDLLKVDKSSVPITRNAFLKADEVIVVRSGAYTGDIAQVTTEWEGCVAGYDMVVTPSEKLVGEFVEAYLLTDYIQKQYFYNLKTRAGQPHLNSNQLESTPFILPPLSIQNDFANKVRAIRAHRKVFIQSSARLEFLNNLIMQRAFSGTLTATWRDAHLKELLVEMEQQAKYLN